MKLTTFQLDETKSEIWKYYQNKYKVTLGSVLDFA